MSTEIARIFFQSHFLKQGFFLLLPASRTCSMPGQDLFVPYLRSVTLNIILILKTYRHIKTQTEKLCNDDVARFPPLSRFWSSSLPEKGEERGLLSRTAAGDRA